MSAELVLEFIGIFIAVFFIFFLIKKLYYRFVLKKQFLLFARISIKGISNIGMVIALSVGVVLLIIFITADLASVVFRLWTGTRIIIEGILIKIGGLLFGPIVGLIMGAVIDFLTIAISAGVFHLGYFLTAILFGFLGGIIRSIILMSKNKSFLFTIYSSLFTLTLTAIIIIIIWFSPSNVQTFSVTLLNIDITITLNQLLIIIGSSTMIPIILLWICYFISRYLMKKKQKKQTWYMIFAPVFITIIVTEIICNILLAPVFDAMISPLGYSAWILIRLLLFIPMVVLNLLIILPVYKVIRPLVNYEFEDDAIKVKKNNKISFKSIWKEIFYEQQQL